MKKQMILAALLSLCATNYAFAHNGNNDNNDPIVGVRIMVCSAFDFKIPAIMTIHNDGTWELSNTTQIGAIFANHATTTSGTWKDVGKGKYTLKGTQIACDPALYVGGAGDSPPVNACLYEIVTLETKIDKNGKLSPSGKLEFYSMGSDGFPGTVVDTIPLSCKQK